MAKNLMAMLFAGAVFVNLPPVDLSRVQAYAAIIFLWFIGLVLVCWIDDLWERVERWKKM